MSLTRRAARAMLATSFISGGLDQIRHPSSKVGAAQPVVAPIAERIPQLPNDPESLIRLDGAIKVAGGIGLVLGPFARPAAMLLAGSLVPTTLSGHRFWEQNDPELKISDRIEFFKNVSLIGGLLIAALDTGGRPSVPWVTGRAARAVAESVGETTESVRESIGSVGEAVADAAGAFGEAVSSSAGKARGSAAAGTGKARGAAAKGAGVIRGAALTSAGAALSAAGAARGAANQAAGTARGRKHTTKGSTKGLAKSARGVAHAVKDRAESLVSH